MGATVSSWHWYWCYVTTSNHFLSMHLFSLHLTCQFKIPWKGSCLFLCGQWKNNNIFILPVLQSCLKLLFSEWPLDRSTVCWFSFFLTLCFSFAKLASHWCVWLYFHCHCTCFDSAVQCLLQTPWWSQGGSAPFSFYLENNVELLFLLLGTSSYWTGDCVCMSAALPLCSGVRWLGQCFPLLSMGGTGSCAVYLVVFEIKLLSVEN